MSDYPVLCSGHILDRRDDGADECMVCGVVIATLVTTDYAGEVKFGPAWRSHLATLPKISCVACVTNPLGWNAKHVCGYPDDVAAASGVV